MREGQGFAAVLCWLMLLLFLLIGLWYRRFRDSNSDCLCYFKLGFLYISPHPQVIVTGFPSSMPCESILTTLHELVEAQHLVAYSRNRTSNSITLNYFSREHALSAVEIFNNQTNTEMILKTLKFIRPNDKIRIQATFREQKEKLISENQQEKEIKKQINHVSENLNTSPNLPLPELNSRMNESLSSESLSDTSRALVHSNHISTSKASVTTSFSTSSQPPFKNTSHLHNSDNPPSDISGQRKCILFYHLPCHLEGNKHNKLPF